MTDDELRSLKVPTLFLVGENEKIYSAERAVARLRRVAPGIETEVIPGAGHFPMMEAHAEFNGRVASFAAEVLRPRRGRRKSA